MNAKRAERLRIKTEGKRVRRQARHERWRRKHPHSANKRSARTFSTARILHDAVQRIRRPAQQGMVARALSGLLDRGFGRQEDTSTTTGDDEPPPIVKLPEEINAGRAS